MGKEATCRVFPAILNWIEERGVQPEIWRKSVPYSVAHLRNRHERIDWASYCQLMKNLRTVLCDDDFEAIGHSWAKCSEYRPWAFFTRLLFGAGKSLGWSQAALRHLGYHFFSCIDFQLDEFGRSGFKVTLKVKDGYEFCREHFLFVKGAMAVVPGFRNYVEVNVRMEWIERGAVFENMYAKPVKAPTWLHKKILWMVSSRETVREIIEAHDALLARYQELEKARRAQQLLTHRLIDSQEQERKRIAGELHDSLGQNLLIICNEIQQFLQNPKARKKDLREVSSLIQEAVDETREIAQNLHPHQLERLGLTGAIQSMLRRVSHPTGIKFQNRIDDIDHLLPAASEIHFYRILQEALNNIVKHSGATEAVIHIRRKPGSIGLLVKDNGHGFSPSTVMDGKEYFNGFGISDMRERTGLLKAKFRISSRRGKGSVILLDVPLPEK